MLPASRSSSSNERPGLVAVFAGADGDGAALAFAVPSLTENDRSLQGGLLAGAGLAYVAGAPIVHGVQGEAKGALVSLGLRVGSPLLGGLVG